MIRLVHTAVNAAADVGVHNSQPEGIGRVVGLSGLACWNNLGRNVVFADTRLRPLAVFGTTLFPDEDDASQFDLDVHAILDVPELELLLVLNHFGAIRGFRRDNLLKRTDGMLVEPSSTWWFVADVERAIVANGRLVGSAPRSDGAVGLLVSDFVDTVPDKAMIPTRLSATSFGEVTALTAFESEDGPLISVGGDRKVAVVPLKDGRVGRAKWEVDVWFRVATVAWHRGELWAAGPDSGDVDDYDWERLKGGGFVAFDPASGVTLRSGPLPDDVAWGTGGVPVAPFGSLLAAASRTGCLHLVDPSTGASSRSGSPLGDVSLGIAHIAVVDERVCCGFNRGGYRLHSFAEPDSRETG